MEILRHANQYQRWAAHAVMPFLGERILEVGSGIGNMSQWLPARQKLVLSETDPQLLTELKSVIQATFGDHPRVAVEQVDLNQDWIQTLAPHHVDTAISFNVLEHIADDAATLGQLVKLLDKSNAPGPRRIINFVPAHNWAYGSIDRGYGHYRRYSPRDFKKIAKKIGFNGRLQFRHFNLAGLPGWFLMNRVFRRKQIGPGAIKTFERICPWIRRIDDFAHIRLKIPMGQSLLAVMSWDPSKQPKLDT